MKSIVLTILLWLQALLVPVNMGANYGIQITRTLASEDKEISNDLPDNLTEEEKAQLAAAKGFFKGKKVEATRRNSLSELGFVTTAGGYYHKESYAFFTNEQAAREYAVEVADMKKFGEWAQHLKDVKEQNRESLLSSEGESLERAKQLLLNKNFETDLDEETIKAYNELSVLLKKDQATDGTYNYTESDKNADEANMTEEEKAQYRAAQEYFGSKQEAGNRQLLKEVISLKTKETLTPEEVVRLKELIEQLPREDLVRALIYVRYKGSESLISAFEKEMNDFALTITGTKEQRAEFKEGYGAEKKKTSGSGSRGRGKSTYVSPEERKKRQQAKVAAERKADYERAIIPHLRKLYFQADTNNYWNKEQKNKFFVPFYEVKYLNAVGRAKRLKEKYLTMINDNKIHDVHKFNLVMIYTSTVYKSIRGMFRLFDRDPSFKSKQLRARYLDELLPEISKELIDDEVKTRLSQSNIKVIDHPDKSEMYQFKLNALGNLTEDIIFHLYVPSSHYYLQATKLITLQSQIEKIQTYNAFVGDKDHFYTKNSCQTTKGAKLPYKLTTNFPDLQTRRQAIKSLLSSVGLLQPDLYNDDNGQPIEDPDLAAYNNFYDENIDVDIMSHDPYATKYNALFPFEQYQNAQAALEILEKEGGILNGWGRYFNTGEKYRRVLLDDSSQFYDVFQAKLYLVAHELDSAKPKKPKKGSGHAARYYSQRVEKFNKDAAEFKIVEDTFKDIMSINETPCLMHMERQTLHCFEDAEKIKKTKKRWNDRYEEVLETKGITKYLVKKLMKVRNDHPNRLEWWKFVSPRVWAKMKKNDIRFDMPSLYANDTWRRWGLQTIYKHLSQKRGDKQTLYRFRILCQNRNTRVPYLCNNDPKSKKEYGYDTDTYVTINRLLLDLRPFTDDGTYIINLAHTDLSKIEPYMPFLRKYWYMVQCGNYTQNPNYCARPNKTDLPDTFVNEEDYIKAQVGSNHWAALRVSYMDALERMNSTGNKYASIYQKLGKILKINETLKPFHSNRVLNHKETISVYKNIIKRVNQQNNYVLQTKSSNGKRYYDHLKDIFSFNFFTPNAIEKANAKFNFIQRGVSTGEFKQDMEVAKNHPYQAMLEDMHKINASRGYPETQKNLFNDFFEKHEYTAGSLKEMYLTMENRYKSPFYRQLIRQSSALRRDKIENDMGEICELRQDDSTKEYNNLFYLTTEAQNILAQNDQMKIEVPKKVKDRVDSMTDEDWHALWLGVGAGIVFAVATIATGGGFAVAALAASLAASAIQVGTAVVEYNQAKESRVSADLVRSFAEDGLTDESGADQVTRSYGWAVMEAAFAIPFVGHLGKAIQIVARVTKANKTIAKNFVSIALKQAAKRSGKVLAADQIANLSGELVKTAGKKGLQETLERITREFGIELAQKEIEILSKKLTKSNTKELIKEMLRQSVKASGQEISEKELERLAKETLKQTKKSIAKSSFMEVESLYAKYLVQVDKLGLKTLSPKAIKATLTKELFEKIIVGETKDQIERGFSKTFVTWFKGDAKQAHKFLKGYSQHKGLFKRAMARMKGAKEGSFLFNRFDSRLGKAQRALLKHEARLADEQTGWLMKKFAGWRHKRLLKYVSSVDDLTRVMDDLAKIQTKQAFYKYVRANSAVIANIIESLPFRKRQIPHMIIAMGSPAVVKPIPIWSSLRKVPFIGGWSDGVILKRMVAARNLLLAEQIAETQRKNLIKAGAKGLESGINSHSTFAVYEAYRQASAVAVAKTVGNAGKNLAESTDKAHYNLAKRVYKNYLAKIGTTAPTNEYAHLTYAEFAKLLDEGDVFAKTVFNNTDRKLIFGTGTKELEDNFLKTFQALSDYKTMGELEEFWKAAKILSMQKKGDLIGRFQ